MMPPFYPVPLRAASFIMRCIARLSSRLVDSFGSTRRRRQLASREEGIVRTEKIGSVGALTQVGAA